METEQDAKAVEAEDDGEVEQVKLDADALRVDFDHSRVTDTRAFAFLRAVTQLSLRRNLIKEVSGLAELRTLVHLDLYDNQIASCQGLEALVNLDYLDLSYNRLGHICHLDSLARLKRLYLIHNKITRMEGLDRLESLELLELGDNKIRAIEGVADLPNLRQLFLGKNKIQRLEGLPANLHTLSVQANRLTRIENLEPLGPSLRELYISENGIREIGGGLRGLAKLEILDLAVNFIAALPAEDLSHLTELEDFWFNDNRLEDWAELSSLTLLPRLSNLYLRGNPINYAAASNASASASIQQRPFNPDYRRKVLLLLPNITRLDSIATK